MGEQKGHLIQSERTRDTFWGRGYLGSAGLARIKQGKGRSMEGHVRKKMRRTPGSGGRCSSSPVAQWGDFVPQEALGDVWRQFELSHLVLNVQRLGMLPHILQWIGQPLTTTENAAPKVSSAKAEKGVRAEEESDHVRP